MKLKIISVNRRSEISKWVIYNCNSGTLLANFYCVEPKSDRYFYCEFINPKIMIEKFNAYLKQECIYYFKTEEDAYSALEYIEPFLIMDELLK